MNLLDFVHYNINLTMKHYKDVLGENQIDFCYRNSPKSYCDAMIKEYGHKVRNINDADYLVGVITGKILYEWLLPRLAGRVAYGLKNIKQWNWANTVGYCAALAFQEEKFEDIKRKARIMCFVMA